MPGRRKCEEGCTCGRHARRLDLTDEERAQRHRDQSREGMRRYNSSGVCPSCGGNKTPRSELCQECKGNAHTNLSPEERRRKSAEYQRNRRLADPEGTRAQAREYQQKNGRRYHIKSKFGITLEDWDRMLRNQSGRCYLCERPLQGGRTDIHIDHDHHCCPGRRSCGKCIRGLACQTCNQGVGQFGDDPQLMRKVADNLEAANSRLRERQHEEEAAP